MLRAIVFALLFAGISLIPVHSQAVEARSSIELHGSVHLYPIPESMVDSILATEPMFLAKHYDGQTYGETIMFARDVLVVLMQAVYGDDFTIFTVNVVNQGGLPFAGNKQLQVMYIQGDLRIKPLFITPAISVPPGHSDYFFVVFPKIYIAQNDIFGVERGH